jgi:hypothetical protein
MGTGRSRYCCSPQAAWSNIQQLLEKLETAVQSRNLPGVHEPGMKIRARFKTLNQNGNTSSGDESQKLIAMSNQLDSSITDLHSATDATNQNMRNTH